MENSKQVAYPKSNADTPSDKLTNLGKAIKYQIERGVSNKEMGRVLGLTDEAWRKNRLKYNDANGNREYDFTLKQITDLNRFLEIPLQDALVHRRDPMAFDEAVIDDIALKNAKKRDSILTRDMLRCIAEADERDLPILQQTANLLVGKSDIYANKFTLLLLGAIRNLVAKEIQEHLPDDDTLRTLVERKLPEAREIIQEKIKDGEEIDQEISRRMMVHHAANLVTEEIMTSVMRNINDSLKLAIHAVISEYLTERLL